MRKTSKKIIVIDDDPCNNYICCRILKSLCEPVAADIRTFTSSEEGLQYLEEHLRDCRTPVLLFLDIRMPSHMSGWNVLDKLHTMAGVDKDCLSIYMLSSSTSQRDKEKALAYPLVKNFIPKPLALSMVWLKDDLFISREKSVDRTYY